MQVIKEEPILECMEVRTNPKLRKSIADEVEAHLWWVVLGFLFGAAMVVL